MFAVINFHPKQIANFMSECLILGIQKEDEVVLLQAKGAIINGEHLF